MPPQVQPADEWEMVPDAGDEWEVVSDSPEAPIRPVASHGETQPQGFLQPMSASEWGGNVVRGLRTRAEALAGFPKALLDDPAAVASGMVKGVAGIPGRLYEDVTDFSRLSREDPVRLVEDAALLPGILRSGVRAAGAVSRKVGSRLANSALQPTKALRTANKGINLGEEMANAGVTVSERGLGKLQGQMGPLRQGVDDAVTAASQAGAVVPRGQLVAAADRVAANPVRFAGQPGALEQVSNVGRHLEETLPDNVPLTDANLLKRSLADVSKPAPGMPRTPMQDAQNSVRATAREAIEAQAPGVKKLNAQLGPKIGVEKALAQRLEGLRGQNTISRTAWGAGASAGAGALMGADPTGLGIAGAALSSPYVRSMLAIPLVKGGRAAAGPVRPMDAALRAALLEAMNSEER